MFKSSENLRLAAEMRALERVARPWREARRSWFDGTPESIEGRLAATERVLTYARGGATPAHMALEREASTARAELREASHRLMVDFLDDSARAFKGSKRVADFDVEAAYYDDGWDGLSEDQEGPRRFNMFPPGGDEINVDGYRYQHDPATKQYLKVSPMGGLEGTPLEPGQEYSGGQFKPHYPDDWDGMSSDQEGPRRFDMRGLVNEEHPYHADEEGRLYGYDPVTQQHLKVSPMGGLEGTPEAPGQQYTDYLPERADRTKGGRDRSARRRVAKGRGLRECINCGGSLSAEDDDDKDSECGTCGKSAHEKGVDWRKDSARTAGDMLDLSSNGGDSGSSATLRHRDDKKNNRYTIQRIPDPAHDAPHRAIVNHDDTELMSADGQHHWAGLRTGGTLDDFDDSLLFGN